MSDALLQDIKLLIDKHIDQKMNETNYILSQIPFKERVRTKR